MKLLLVTRFIGKFILPGIVSISLLLPQGFYIPTANRFSSSTSFRRDPKVNETGSTVGFDMTRISADFPSTSFSSDANSDSYSFGNPAGCSSITPSNLSPEGMLADVQAELGSSFNLAQNRVIYIWNGPLNSMLDVSKDKFAYEFSIDAYQPPFTYKADQLATTFLNNGFVIWFRSYGGHFRLLAVPMSAGVFASAWADYVKAYWRVNGIPADNTVQPTTKKLPCHWVIDAGWVTNEQLLQLFDFNWNLPDYLTIGRKFLASTCKEANQVSQQELGYWDATSMCGPLAWRIIKDANSFPYRIGNWYSSASLFTQANPRWNGRPWIGFDPGTYDLISIKDPMMSYDFAGKGNLYPGDIVYSYSTLYAMNDGRFDHIFLVAGVNADNSRVSITNVIQNSPYADCSIREIVLYTPGNTQTGFIYHEWNNHGFGSTGSTGFDVLRWKWVTYHLQGESVAYTVRWGDTIETIAFDWKISPQRILNANHLTDDVQLIPGHMITLPSPLGEED